jgi:arylsulfatase A-like enzyme
LLTGQYSHHHHVEENTQGKNLDESNTLATWLQASGYRTSLIGKYLNGYPFGRGLYKPPGWDNWQVFTGEPDYYNYKLYENGVTHSFGSATSDYSTDVLTNKAVDFINASSAQPFFLFFAPKTPHNPFNEPTPRHTNDPACTDVGTAAFDRPNFAEADVSDKPEWVQKRPLPNVGAERANRKHQCEMLLALDDDVQSIFTALTNKGVLDNTVVVYMTDNGYANGRHRFSTKRCEYEECIETPLLVRYPGFTPHTVDQMATNVDIAPTFAELAGATPGIHQDGYSLVPLLDQSVTTWKQDDAGVLIEYIGFGNPSDPSPVPGYWGVRTRQYKYVELSTGEKELYDLTADPWELQNRADDPALASVQQQLKKQLNALKAKK